MYNNEETTNQIIKERIEQLIAKKKENLIFQKRVAERANALQQNGKARYFEGLVSGTEYELEDLQSILNIYK